jgi:hypothetical protein
MDKLYPIVRRVRRPLLPVEEPQRPQIPAVLENESKSADAPAPEEKQNESADETQSA